MTRERKVTRTSFRSPQSLFPRLFTFQIEKNVDADVPLFTPNSFSHFAGTSFIKLFQLVSLFLNQHFVDLKFARNVVPAIVKIIFEISIYVKFTDKMKISNLI